MFSHRMEYSVDKVQKRNPFTDKNTRSLEALKLKFLLFWLRSKSKIWTRLYWNQINSDDASKFTKRVCIPEKQDNLFFK